MSYELEGRLNELADRFDEEWAAAVMLPVQLVVGRDS